mmetsp:Transcript_120/g.21  ORF Transcript_120/g.21 Transcript_120/m.21 type:complete len:81 (+) Transcript_120:335-577(+)
MDSMPSLTKISGPQLTLGKFYITFEKEEGLDFGGLTREWITLAIKDVLDPAKGLFVTSANGVTLRPNPKSHIIPGHLNHF